MNPSTKNKQINTNFLLQKGRWHININKGVYIRTKHDKILYCLSMNIKCFYLSIHFMAFMQSNTKTIFLLVSLPFPLFFPQSKHTPTESQIFESNPKPIPSQLKVNAWIHLEKDLEKNSNRKHA